MNEDGFRCVYRGFFYGTSSCPIVIVDCMYNYYILLFYLSVSLLFVCFVSLLFYVLFHLLCVQQHHLFGASGSKLVVACIEITTIIPEYMLVGG